MGEVAAGDGGQRRHSSPRGRVTVFDSLPRQLEQDESVARRDGLKPRTVLGDMRDLSTFPNCSFDLVERGQGASTNRYRACPFRSRSTARPARPSGKCSVRGRTPWAAAKRMASSMSTGVPVR
ncbi:hypothetical protein C5N14_29490 [Micromonospora sp. MW-13]|nr:hypothetical protein C5N14_29490 [Micromonospora sp. MW-13]